MSELPSPSKLGTDAAGQDPPRRAGLPDRRICDGAYVDVYRALDRMGVARGLADKHGAVDVTNELDHIMDVLISAARLIDRMRQECQ